MRNRASRFGHRVVASCPERMAARDALSSKPKASQGTVPLDSFHAVLAAGRKVAAGDRQRGGNGQPIEADESQQNRLQRASSRLWALVVAAEGIDTRRSLPAPVRGRMDFRAAVRSARLADPAGWRAIT